MIEITKQIRFEAAHRLPDHDGKCQRLHGHSWVGRVYLRGALDDLNDKGPQRGMLADFGRVADVLKDIRDQYLDHHHLNESLDLYPTSEKIAAWLFNKVTNRTRKRHGDELAQYISATEIEETCTSSAKYESNLDSDPDHHASVWEEIREVRE
jgi:6-pyruvoyltetrahydropterin/6-carboxytetrahydropterin synthase